MNKMKKWTALAVSLVLLFATVGGTLAFLIDTSGPIQNIFNPSKVTTQVEETINGTTKSNVKIKNTGDTDAWIRAAVVITWQDEQGNVYGTKPVENTDYTIGWGNWQPGDDGFYYWPSPVAPNGLTGNLIDTCTSKNPLTVGTGDNAVTYYLNVEIIGSGIQSKPASVFNTEWASSHLKVKTEENGVQLDPSDWTLVKEG